jgi:hypothetical protein
LSTNKLQVTPVKPKLQLHVKLFPNGLQKPLKQGLDWHGLNMNSQLAPVKPGKHEQEKEPVGVLEHIPFAPHGFAEHGLIKTVQ